ncbi:hypothetical protein AJ80_02459 [Polytolypa hystricis UAMH7299]|uniref:DUF726 domain-containing protein n=1 Tax=Polytolypa hystricis (strain UAMH7299) TaxID=1447883 RepID=A0A2B7YQC9_POLH7|nr:hypothetical protein AJ80_02459 [Polytolypa hystricis UAMH7299]
MAHQRLSQQGTGKQESTDKDLRAILNLTQRQQLMRLLTDIIDSMVQILCDDDPPQDVKNDLSSPSPESDPHSDKVMVRRMDEQMSTPPPKLKRSPTNIEIKTEAEAFRAFGSWKDAALLRVRQVLNGSSSQGQEHYRNEGSESICSTGTLQSDTSSQNIDEHSVILDRAHPVLAPVPTPLRCLPLETKLLILNALLLLLLSLEHYSAHSRVLLLRVAASLGLSSNDLADHEIKVAKGLLSTAKQMSADDETKERIDRSKFSRKWKVGLASVAGAALIGVTGGLAAPLVAAGIGAVMGGLGLGATVAATYLGAMAGSSVIIGGLFGAYGARMSGRMMSRYAKEVEDFAFIPTRSLREKDDGQKGNDISTDQRLRVTIGISGWLTAEEDIVNPWLVLGDDSDTFALRWEFRSLLRLGNALTVIVRSSAWTVATKQMVAGTAFAGLLNAIMWPVGILKLSHIVDNPFSIAKTRADKAGAVLADALINRAQGERPVTLIGYSLGSRIIYSCLLKLAERRAFGLVESAILIGSPTPSTTSKWRLMRTVVSGRLVNVYSLNDSILGFLYRTNSLQLSIAGLGPVAQVHGVENFDVSDSVTGHLRYQYMVGTILDKIGLNRLDKDELKAQVDTLNARTARDEAQREEEQMETDWGQYEGEAPPLESSEVMRMEREVEERTEEVFVHSRVHAVQLGDNE